ncbi:sulfatase [Roseicitreum antarcticum]|uniref:Phosphoglycerol transferase MdoB n=1 Tax=Roseicitreum antarcticum TaxID=564137 RepID=A0A1H2ZCC4_9RHOB|nr:sulfatase [Roseicitreum antarcticum]SDX15153.1 hypothetical protein SAMN04488238_105332 [Roseicitreum antarcticum]
MSGRIAPQAIARHILAAAVLYLLLIQPNHPAAMTWGALRAFPLELPVILSLLVLTGNGWTGRVLRAVLITLLMAVALLKLADFGTFVAFNRGFNLLVDLNLLHAGWTLAQGTFGMALAMLAGLGALGALVLMAGMLWWATGVWARHGRPGWLRVTAAILILPATVAAVAEVGQARRLWSLPAPVADAIPGAAFTARLALERVMQFAETRAELAAFRTAARTDPMAGGGPFLDLAGDRDVILIYVESYGRASFDNPLYRPTHSATLRQIGADLDGRGLAMRSGWAVAPMTGGQSWLAHGTVASGLWLDDQGRYRALLASERQTLFHYASASGRRSVAIMPAHVFPWPEGAYFGFDAIYNAPDLGYEGQPFNWVTMPDQFTLTALDRLERTRPQGTPGRDPLLAQVALVSSHAPWVPIPPVIDWEAVGDGTVFDPWATSGDPPDVVWRDHDRVREQYRRAIDYSLQTVGSWAARHADNPPLIIMLGDHQTAGFVSGVTGFDVPVHIIGPPDLVARFDGPGWQAGMFPDPAAPALRMDAMRDVILRALSSDAP